MPVVINGSTGISGNRMPAKAATSRAQSPAALTTRWAWIVPFGVTTSQDRSGRWLVSSTGGCR